MRRSYLAPPEKASDCMECNRTKYALFSQIFQNGKMQRSMLEFIAFAQIYRDLNRHGSDILQPPRQGCAR